MGSISLKKINKSFDSTEVLKNINLDIEDGEFLILIGVFKKSFLVATIASLGVILAAAYMLWLYKRIIFGEILINELKKLNDLSKTELFILSSLVFPIIFFGFYPEPLLNTVEVSIRDLIEMYNNNLNINLIKN